MALNNVRNNRRAALKVLFVVLLIIGTAVLHKYSVSFPNEAFMKSALSAFDEAVVDNSFANNRTDKYANIVFEPTEEDIVSPFGFIPAYDKYVGQTKDFNEDWNVVSEQLLFQNLHLNARCKFYFRGLYAIDPNWFNTIKEIFYMIDDKEEDELTRERDRKVAYSLRRKLSMTLVMERMRLHDKCFSGPDAMDINSIFDENDSAEDTFILDALRSLFPKNDFDAYKKADSYDYQFRMFPFIERMKPDTLQKYIPIIRDSNLQVLKEDVVPTFDEESRQYDLSKKFTFDKTKDFWSNWRDMSKQFGKKGIVMCVSDLHLRLALKQLATLRFQGNVLPIQFIYKNGELSEESMRKLSKMAIGDDFNLPKTASTGFNTRQTVWFLDVSRVIRRSVLKTFNSYRNKWITMMFSLFDEVLFMDADVVTYLQPQRYFDMEQYKTHKALYFRDKVQLDKVDERCPALLKSLFPSEMEGKYFEIIPKFDNNELIQKCEKNLNTEESIYRNFFVDGKKHQMEAGLIVIDKTKNMLPLIIGSVLHRARKVSTCSFGDKELFWFASLIAAKDYSFNDLNAGTMGSLTEQIDTKTHQRSRICGVQVVHFSPDKRPLWINGGTSPSKNLRQAEEDWEDPRCKNFMRNFSSLDDLKRFYYHTSIESDFAIITPKWVKSTTYYGRQLVSCAQYEETLKKFSFDEKEISGELIELSDDDKKKVSGLNTVWTEIDLEKYGFLD